MEKTYDVDYFIEFFSAIPEDKWCVGVQSNGKGQCCAFGHIFGLDGMREGNLSWFTEKGRALDMLDLKINFVAVNNGRSSYYQQPTPKARILAALYDIKRKQYPELTHPPVTAEQVIEELEGVVNITA